MEITLHTPLREWYTETPKNPLGWWGIDYPPLSAYQSYLTGLMIDAIEPQATALVTSRGYESPSSKRAMRASVILWDLLGKIELVSSAAAACAELHASVTLTQLAAIKQKSPRISCDMRGNTAVLIPALAYVSWGVAKVAAAAVPPKHGAHASMLQRGAFLLTFGVAVMQPALILIDHGHFQYNGIGLGLTVRH
jgi:alpha-1,3-glucosyltransferase